MLVLPQTTKNTGNDTKVDPNAGDGTGDFYLRVAYQVSNYYDELKIPFSDLNGLAAGLTFEMGRQYALTLSFAENEAGGPVGVKFQLEVEDWDGKTEEAYAATTVVFANNIPVDAAGNAFTQCTITNNICSKFIHGQSIATTTNDDEDESAGYVLGQAAPKLAGYTFLGYYDAREGGTQYFAADADGHLIVAAANKSFDGTNWDKVGPSCTLYAHWEEYYPLIAQSNIYFDPDPEGDGSVGSLTFFEKGGTVQQHGYQGLYFKWGSLIGVSAAVGGNSAFSAAYLYIPDVSTGKYYKVKVVEVTPSSGVQAVKEFADVVTGWTGVNGDWVKIPHDLTDYPTGRGLSPLTDASQPLYSSYKGDICKFLSDKSASKLNRNWVMPKSEIFGGDANGSYSFVNGTTVDPALLGVTYSKEDLYWNSSNPPSFTIPSAVAEGEDGRGYNTSALVTFTTAANKSATIPASGYRNGGNGALNVVGNYGGYWSSSVRGASIAYYLFFNSSSVYPARYDSRAFGRSVRCVQN
jgi:hypothetical protein